MCGRILVVRPARPLCLWQLRPLIILILLIPLVVSSQSQPELPMFRQCFALLCKALKRKIASNLCTKEEIKTKSHQTLSQNLRPDYNPALTASDCTTDNAYTRRPILTASMLQECDPSEHCWSQLQSTTEATVSQLIVIMKPIAIRMKRKSSEVVVNLWRSSCDPNRAKPLKAIHKPFLTSHLYLL